MKSIKSLLLIACCALSVCSCHKPQPIVVIPEPVECTPKSGSFTIDNETYLCFENLGAEAGELSKIIHDTYRQTFGIKHAKKASKHP